MSYSLVTNAGAVQTTTGVTTTGATLIVLWQAYDSGATVSDSKSNTWTALTNYSGVATFGRMYYCLNPTVGTAHTFSTSISYGAIFMQAWRGNKVTLPFDQENGSTGTGTTRQPGSVTPSEANELVVSGIALGSPAVTPTINSGFSATNVLDSGAAYGGGLAYLIQTTATATNPTWSWSGSANTTGANATFKAAPSNGGFFLVS